MPVASAAPRIPIAGNGPMPKMSSGSSTIFVTQPDITISMVAFMQPIA